ncbi:hypothetical protein GGR28_000327 [Lewinella aquimaris]|uniref:Acetyltransferase (GNAT) family protein n=1 Tax=Neolewinella aquimaris TaxID=1835722 RepID=A0A840E9L7_9BACT|nr:GNAT family N-acetyltransferase [Neolewinella aquimaris]MBB4077726.1 hypothetical protein [Neolewinella aquimaris]
MTASVRRLRRNQIDDARWDQAVLEDARPLPYALSWWLDAVTERHWDGLVYGDYTAVLPLPRLRRFGIVPALVRPPYTQQLGPFGALNGRVVGALLQAVPAAFQISLPLRTDLDPGDIPDRFARRRRTNYVLDLDRPYADLTRAFPKKLQAYLKKSKEDVLVSITPAALVSQCRQQLGARDGMRESHFRRLRDLIDAATPRGHGQSYALWEEGELLAVGFYPELGGRTINLVAASTPRGRKRRGMSRLIALVLKDRAGNAGAVFDFEGSELPGVGAFFAKFGSFDEGYWLIEEKLFGLA